MRDINVGIVGLGHVGSGAVTILAENADEIAARLGFRLNLEAVCSRSALARMSEFDFMSEAPLALAIERGV